MLSRLVSRTVMKVSGASISGANIPAVNMSRYLNQSLGWEEDCKTCATNLRDYGVIYIKDPRADFSYNWKLIDLMEKYYDLRTKQLAQGMDGPELDIIPSKHQHGLTKPYYEQNDDYKEMKMSLKAEEMCYTPMKSFRDSTITYAYDYNNSFNPLPKQFPEFGHIFKTWGGFQRECTLTVAEMIAIGLGMPKMTFRELIEKGECLVQPPGVHLKDLEVGKIICSFHIDFTLLTCHGKNRFPGLHVWTRKGERFQPVIPEDHFIIHGGQQMEWVTGGYMMPAYHEVYYGEDTDAAKQKAIKEGRSVWRIASSCFSHMEGKRVMRPMDPFRTPEAVKKYYEVTSDDYYRAELDHYDRQ